MRAESIREPNCRQRLLELRGPSGPSLTRLSSENQPMELKLTYRHLHLIGHVASTFVLLNASCAEGSVRRWWVALSTLSYSSLFGRCFSTSRHEKKSLQIGDRMKSTVSYRHPWTSLMTIDQEARWARKFHHLRRPVRYGCFATSGTQDHSHGPWTRNTHLRPENGKIIHNCPHYSSKWATRAAAPPTFRVHHFISTSLLLQPLSYIASRNWPTAKTNVTVFSALLHLPRDDTRGTAFCNALQVYERSLPGTGDRAFNSNFLQGADPAPCTIKLQLSPLLRRATPSCRPFRQLSPRWHMKPRRL